MAESGYHIKMVEKIYNYILLNYKNIVSSFVLADTPYSLSKPSRTIRGFCPDIYYCFDKKLIIGEAKTINDIERNHSLQQYKSYIEEASGFDGECTIIFAVPWSEAYTLKSILKNMKPQNKDIEILILTDIGRLVEV